MKNYRRLTAGLIAAWFVFALVGGALHLFKNNSNSIGAAVGLAAFIPIVIFVLWFAASEKFRGLALFVDRRALTALQFWRILGIVFVVLEARGALPAIFAFPAGYGDIAIGATAAFAAWKLAEPAHRTGFIVWQLLGITDLVTAVTLGTTAGLLDPHGARMVAMTVLPLSLIPTFLVPLFFIFHIICIAQARTWSPAPGAAGESQTVRPRHSFTATACPLQRKA